MLNKFLDQNELEEFKENLVDVRKDVENDIKNNKDPIMYPFFKHFKNEIDYVLKNMDKVDNLNKNEQELFNGKLISLFFTIRGISAASETDDDFFEDLDLDDEEFDDDDLIDYDDDDDNYEDLEEADYEDLEPEEVLSVLILSGKVSTLPEKPFAA